MKKLATTLSIIFGFNIVNIIVFTFFIRTSLIVLSFLAAPLITAAFFTVSSEDTNCI